MKKNFYKVDKVIFDLSKQEGKLENNKLVKSFRKLTEIDFDEIG
jgi:hypothetical protein